MEAKKRTYFCIVVAKWLDTNTMGYLVDVSSSPSLPLGGYVWHLSHDDLEGLFFVLAELLLGKFETHRPSIRTFLKGLCD